jgi:hypothetical protein
VERRVRGSRDRLRVVGADQAWEDPGPLGGDEPIDPTGLYALPIEEGEYDAAFIDQARVDGMFRTIFRGSGHAAKFVRCGAGARP